MEHNQLDAALLTKMPNQEEFKNLTVHPSDICARSSNWETSKKLKPHLSDKCTLKQPIANCSEPTIYSEKIATTTTSDRDEHNQTGSLESPDDECEIITFIIGAARIHDTSKPMPPPSRFVRKGFVTL